MRLWIDTNAVNSAGRAVRAAVKEQTENINRQVLSRGVRGVNALRNAELNVLKGQRSGRRYRKYPFKSSYTASAPGEAPARRTGNLRLHWNGQVRTVSAARNGISVIAELESQESYASFLENGTSNMAPRSFMDRIKEEVVPEIRKIYSEPFK